MRLGLQPNIIIPPNNRLPTTHPNTTHHPPPTPPPTPPPQPNPQGSFNSSPGAQSQGRKQMAFLPRLHFRSALRPDDFSDRMDHGRTQSPGEMHFWPDSRERRISDGIEPTENWRRIQH